MTLEGKNITKTIGQKKILSDISLAVPKGQFVAIFGPNGAGKSTLLKILALLVKCDSGAISICGEQWTGNNYELKSKIGLIFHNSFLYPELTAYENLKFFSSLYNLNIKGQISEFAELVGLKTALYEPVYTFSRGMLQRLSIARALIHNPEIVFLDEPFTGLDQNGIKLLENILRDLKSKNKTIIMVTHDFEQSILDIDRAIILKKGKIAADQLINDIDVMNLKEIYLQRVAS